MNNYALTALFLVSLSLNIFGQKTISGTITSSNDGEIIPGVTVMIKGSSQGTITDMDGHYSLEITDTNNTILVICFIGFQEEEIVYTGQKEINIALTEDLLALDEVVVVGYGTTKKHDLTGAVTRIRGASLIGASRRSLPGLKKGKISDESITKELKQNDKLLTAGEINDFSKWELWKDLTNDELKRYQTTWEFNPQHRYAVQILDTNQQPVIDATVILVNETGVELWRAKTENTGKAELWNLDTDTNNISIIIKYNTQEFTFKNPSLFENGLNRYTLQISKDIPLNVDVAFIVDATGSMCDEINYLRAELYSIMNTVKQSLKDKNLNLATVFYRDKTDAYVTKKSEFSDNINNSIDFIKNNGADGGGDFPEAVDQGLAAAIDSLEWSKDALCRVAFLILDAPPHEDSDVQKGLNRLIAKAASNGIRLVPVTCSGIDKSTEYLMRSFALLTNGTYVFLTDDSGIGDSHIKPSTDSYDVELLNDLLLRLLYQYTYLPDNIYRTEETEWEENISFLKSADQEEKSEERLFKAFPNPCRDIINIKCKSDISELFINDISGKILERHINLEQTFSTDLSVYPEGTYFINVKLDDETMMQKMIVRVNN